MLDLLGLEWAEYELPPKNLYCKFCRIKFKTDHPDVVVMKGVDKWGHKCPCYQYQVIQLVGKSAYDFYQKHPF